MLFKSNRLAERQEGIDLFNKIVGNNVKALAIHYSCESFITSHGRTPRVTSISIRNLKNDQSTSFSIHLQAQISGKDFNNINEEDYDTLEKEMLSHFYEFVKKHSTHKWVHWNMRNANYGFEAIKNRYRILGGEPNEIDNDLKHDLPIIISKIFTKNYEKHEPNGKLLNLVQRNNITDRDVLTGKAEAEAFDKKNYLKLHMSTLRKVDIITSIVNHIKNGTLKVHPNSIAIYGLSFTGILEIIRNSWLLTGSLSFASFIAGAALEPIVQKIFGTAYYCNKKDNKALQGTSEQRGFSKFSLVALVPGKPKLSAQNLACP